MNIKDLIEGNTINATTVESAQSKHAVILSGGSMKET